MIVRPTESEIYLVEGKLSLHFIDSAGEVVEIALDEGMTGQVLWQLKQQLNRAKREAK